MELKKRNTIYARLKGWHCLLCDDYFELYNDVENHFCSDGETFVKIGNTWGNYQGVAP